MGAAQQPRLSRGSLLSFDIWFWKLQKAHAHLSHASVAKVISAAEVSPFFSYAQPCVASPCHQWQSLWHARWSRCIWKQLKPRSLGGIGYPLNTPRKASSFFSAGRQVHRHPIDYKIDITLPDAKANVLRSGSALIAITQASGFVQILTSHPAFPRYAFMTLSALLI